jgi:hypothetical protein
MGSLTADMVVLILGALARFMPARVLEAKYQLSVLQNSAMSICMEA